MAAQMWMTNRSFGACSSFLEGSPMYDHLPGGEILRKGLKDLQDGVRSIEALLLLVAAPRLTRCGITIPPAAFPVKLPEHELYRLLCEEHGPEAYRHYRSLMRRLVSLENALENQAALV